MQSSVAENEPRSFMDELVELLSAFPPDRNKRGAQVIALRLEHLETRARSQGAATETMAAIQGARVLLELGELPPLSRLGAIS